jgi:hypothetical protein
VLATYLATTPTTADTRLPADFPSVVAGAGVIVRGVVSDVRAFRLPSTGEVETAVTIIVDATLKGDPVRVVSMRLPGGLIGRYRSVMVGAPRLSVGDRGVFFLARAPGGPWWPVGLASGVYRITSGATGPEVLPPLMPGATTSTTGPVVRGDRRRRPLAVSEFESLVRLVLQTSSGGAK